MEKIENIIAEEEFTYVKAGEKPSVLKMQIGEAKKTEDGFYECQVRMLLDGKTRNVRSGGSSSYEAVKTAIELLSINFFSYKKDGDLFIDDWKVETILPKDYWEHDNQHQKKN